MSRRGTTKRGGLPKKRTRNPCPGCGRVTGHASECPSAPWRRWNR